MTAPAGRDRIPSWVELPLEWPRMSWRAQERWLARTLAAGQRTETDEPEEGPQRPVDDKGRPVFTREEMLTANVAYNAHRVRNGPDLTEEQRDAYRAHERAKGMASRRAAGIEPPALTAQRKTAQRVEAAQALLAAGMSLEDAASQLDTTLQSLRRSLIRAEGRARRRARPPQ